MIVGRVNLIDVAKSLNVDFNVIQNLAQDIIKEDSGIRIILGQLVDHTYSLHVAEEISDRLQQHGIISITELARTFDLPGDFIHSVCILKIDSMYLNNQLMIDHLITDN